MAMIAVFDLDGVIIESPSRETIPDINYWIKFWNDIDRHIPHFGILKMIESLVVNKVHVFILTARPISLLGVTQDSLRQKCDLTPRHCSNPYTYGYGWSTMTHLMMRDRDAKFDDWDGNAVWKKEVIKVLQIDNEVLFAVEDYKPNAQEMRKVVPVLLYEQLRGD